MKQENFQNCISLPNLAASASFGLTLLITGSYILVSATLMLWIPGWISYRPAIIIVAFILVLLAVYYCTVTLRFYHALFCRYVKGNNWLLIYYAIPAALVFFAVWRIHCGRPMDALGICITIFSLYLPIVGGIIFGGRKVIWTAFGNYFAMGVGVLLTLELVGRHFIATYHPLFTSINKLGSGHEEQFYIATGRLGVMLQNFLKINDQGWHWVMAVGIVLLLLAYLLRIQYFILVGQLGGWNHLPWRPILTLWILLVLIFVTGIVLTMFSDQRVRSTRKKLEICIGVPLGSSSLKELYYAGQTGNALFYTDLATLLKKITNFYNVQGDGKKRSCMQGQRFISLTLEELYEGSALMEAMADNFDRLDDLLSRKIPKFPLEYSDSYFLSAQMRTYLEDFLSVAKINYLRLFFAVQTGNIAVIKRVYPCFSSLSQALACETDFSSHLYSFMIENLRMNAMEMLVEANLADAEFLTLFESEQQQLLRRLQDQSRLIYQSEVITVANIFDVLEQGNLVKHTHGSVPLNIVKLIIPCMWWVFCKNECLALDHFAENKIVDSPPLFVESERLAKVFCYHLYQIPVKFKKMETRALAELELLQDLK